MRKLKTLAISTLTTFLLTILLAACGGGAEPAPQEPITQQESQTDPTNQSVPATQNDPLPTKPTPLTNLGAQPPTATPAPTRARPTRPPQDTDAPNTVTDPPEATAGPASTQRPEDLIPEDPATNDTVLLQDIYELIDMDQFALDPTQPIERFKRGRIGGTHEIANLSMFSLADTIDHPYLFMFPKLKHYIEREAVQRNPRSEVPYSPYMKRDYSPDSHKDGHLKLVKGFNDNNPLVYFIYHPWYETIDFSIGGHSISSESPHRRLTSNATYVKYGPYWFGNNSTKGVLSEAIAKAMTDAKHPATEPLELIWNTGNPRGEPVETDAHWAWTNWKLDDYLRTAVSRFNEAKSGKEWFPQPLTDKGRYIGRYLTETYHEPIIQWEFVHPELPILKITAENSTVLPLTVGGIERPKPTEYSVSFVISLQNRWASLDDPNRMLARFPKEIKGIVQSPFLPGHRDRDHITRERHDGNLDSWNFTDYMQHKIIGPVVIQIHESEVLQPGIYSATPKVTHWEAPGYIPLDEQIMEFYGDTRTPKPENYKYFTKYSPSRFNVDWPLPGHIVTDSWMAPGSELWSLQKMDQNDW